MGDDPGETPYQISGSDVLLEWIARQTDSAAVDSMLAWMVELARTPYEGQHLPKPGVPMLARPTPVTNTMVVYSVIEQYRTVKLIRFDRV